MTKWPGQVLVRAGTGKQGCIHSTLDTKSPFQLLS